MTQKEMLIYKISWTTASRTNYIKPSSQAINLSIQSKEKIEEWMKCDINQNDYEGYI